MLAEFDRRGTRPARERILGGKSDRAREPRIRMTGRKGKVVSAQRPVGDGRCEGQMKRAALACLRSFLHCCTKERVRHPDVTAHHYEQASVHRLVECGRVGDRSNLSKLQLSVQRDGENEPTHRPGKARHPRPEQLLDRPG